MRQRGIVDGASRVIVASMLALAACTDFQFDGEIKCSGLGNCPPDYFCDTSGGDVCRRDLASCGNGQLEGDEVCDDGNRTTGDGCRADCLKAELCGDGVQDPQEPCDDGNTVGGDGCSADCKVETCGDGVLDVGEECDDGAANATTAHCLPSCKIATCGDGFVEAGVEACDDGAGNAETAACLPTCVVASCGDGFVQAGVEDCDDANDVATDACNACQAARCGDQAIQYGVEFCDDGDAIDGNTCSNSCRSDKVVQVVSGLEHSCALRAGGKVRCWGDSSLGQLGYGNTRTVGDDEPPALTGDVAVGGTVIQLAAGDSHTCALLDTGAVRCWGNAGNGRLGYGNAESIGDDELPASAGDVPLGGVATQIAAGGTHTCALLATGAVRCWGNGTLGRLGYGNTTTIGDNETPASAGDVPLGGVATQIVAGGSHTCALLATGAVRCWGNGAQGRLGYGNTDTIGDNETPASAGDLALGVAALQLAAGSAHTCAVLATHQLRCWGAGTDGRLGYGAVADLGDNEPPTANVSLGGNAVQVTAGDRHTCALFDTGAMRCWGAGADGRLGYGNTASIGDDELPSSVGTVAAGTTVAQIAAGGSHTCVLLTKGTVRCWGLGTGGRLGYGNSASIGDDEPPFGDVFLTGAVTQVAVGAFHTCALGDTGTVRCWGSGGNGRLGYGNTNDLGDNEAPSTVGDVDVGGFVVQVVAGGAHSCALLDTGKVRCWGFGGNGALGYGNTNDIGDDETPASAGDVPVGGTVVQLAAGDVHTCALLDTGDVRCWGRGDDGRLGYGNTTTIGDGRTPASAGDVPVGGVVQQITAGEAHTCALLVGGTVRCWGNGADSFGFGDGRLGYATNADIGDNETPASVGDVAVGGSVAQIAAGRSHTCAVLSTGAVRCWGAGADGRLGYGRGTANIGDDETPASAGDVPVGGAVTQVATGDTYSCAVLANHAVRCWGNGLSGRLGYGNELSVGSSQPASSAGDVPIGGGVLEVGAGSGQTCARMTTGKLRCWGLALQGQTGHGNTIKFGDDEPASLGGDVSVF